MTHKYAALSLMVLAVSCGHSQSLQPRPCPVQPPVVSPKVQRITIWPVGFRRRGRGAIQGVAISVREAGECTPVSIGSEYPAGVGETYRSAIWFSAATAARMLGKTVSDFCVHVQSLGYVDGPSSSSLLAAAMMAAIQKKKIRQDVTITGIIDGMGNIHPVGGAAEKIRAAAGAGKRVIGFPAALNNARNRHSGLLAKLESTASLDKVEIVWIRDLFEAYKLLTGSELAGGTAKIKIALSPGEVATLRKEKDRLRKEAEVLLAQVTKLLSGEHEQLAATAGSISPWLEGAVKLLQTLKKGDGGLMIDYVQARELYLILVATRLAVAEMGKVYSKKQLCEAMSRKARWLQRWRAIKGDDILMTSARLLGGLDRWKYAFWLLAHQDPVAAEMRRLGCSRPQLAATWKGPADRADMARWWQRTKKLNRIEAAAALAASSPMKQGDHFITNTRALDYAAAAVSIEAAALHRYANALVSSQVPKNPVNPLWVVAGFASVTRGGWGHLALIAGAGAVDLEDAPKLERGLTSFHEVGAMVLGSTRVALSCAARLHKNLGQLPLPLRLAYLEARAYRDAGRIARARTAYYQATNSCRMLVMLVEQRGKDYQDASAPLNYDVPVVED